MKTNIVIEYKECMVGETYTFQTCSKFVAQKLVESVVEFARDNNMPLHETKLKVISYKKHYMQCAIAVESDRDAMIRMTLYYN